MTLRAAGIGVRYEPRRILDDLDLDLRPGESTALVGPNGAGKSTLLRILAGVQTPDDGLVTLDDESLATRDTRANARAISLMTQHLDVPFALSARDVAMLGRAPHLGLLGLPGDDDATRVRDAFERLEVSALADEAVNHLSGGERQRVHCAMMLVQDADIALFDEPTSAQDFRGVGLIVRELRRLATAGRTVAAAVHDLNIAARWFDRIVLLHAGRIAADGPPAEVLHAPALQDAYGDAVHLVDVGEAVPWAAPHVPN